MCLRCVPQTEDAIYEEFEYLAGIPDPGVGMPENVIEQISSELRRTAAQLYPNHGELKNVRLVGHTPKPEHYIYDIVIDFADGSERVAAKVYRNGKGGSDAKAKAKVEDHNLRTIYKTFEKKKLAGVPRPLGDFIDLGAVVAEKVTGVPLLSSIMKAALLPGYADNGTLMVASRLAGEWLRTFHKVTADMPIPFDSEALMDGLQKVCISCRKEGLDDAAIGNILTGARQLLSRTKKALPSSAVMNDFTPLDVTVGEKGVGVCDYARMNERGHSFHDIAIFLASVEALEKYPFCNRAITSQIQEEFLNAYKVSPSEMNVLRVLKMKALLSMFARGRTVNVKESAVRKKVMWANVMKQVIQKEAQRSLGPAA